LLNDDDGNDADAFQGGSKIQSKQLLFQTLNPPPASPVTNWEKKSLAIKKTREEGK
jgi:hypothetical protein